MSEKDDPQCHTPELPTEIFTQIFAHLPAKKLVHCRRVCIRWKDIIDSLKNNHALWQHYCMNDYEYMFISMKHRIRVDMTYYDLYRAFSLWPIIDQAEVVQDEFAPATRVSDEITSFVLLQEDVIGVHTENSIIYYSLTTLNKIKRDMLIGRYTRYAENREVIVLLNVNLLLFILRKVVYGKSQEKHATFDRVTNFLLVDDKVYYVRENDDLLVCNYHEDLHSTYINKCNEDIVSLGYKDGILYFVTFEKNIYKLDGIHFLFLCSLNDSNNLLHTMSKYNLLEQLNWHIYTQWMFLLRHNIPEGPLRSTIVVQVYGDVVFVGTRWGVLRIYYAPYTDGELDLNNAEPIKQFNFMKPDSCPVLSYSPIMHINVVEGINEHIVLVAMPKKIAVLKFMHNFRKTSSIGIVPCINYVENVSETIRS